LQIIALGVAGLFDKSFDHPFVDDIAPGYHHAREGNRVADFQVTDHIISDWSGYLFHWFTSGTFNV
jgi:hypothetical protein